MTDSTPEEGPKGAIWLHPQCDGVVPVYGVYFVLGKASGLVKIGYAKDAWKRFSSMQTGSPEELGMLGIIETYLPVELERELHERFAADRVRGEWFRITDPIFNYVMEHGRRGWDD